MHYGADYNPEQWPEEIWPEDVARMREAGVTMVSVGIFSWARIQPAEGVFDFEWLDRVIGLLHDAGIRVDLATATASPPPWAGLAYPGLLAADEDGAPYWHGSRQHYAPSSPDYRRLAGELVRRLAERYAEHPAIELWHVNNEYGCHLPVDYSDAARDAFRRWLRGRYDDIDALNAAWGTMFWAQAYASFDEVMPPKKAPYSHNPGQLLDYQRFTSDMWLECYLMERDIIRAAGATQPITTNFMGPFKPANYAQWAPHLDVISDDSYPDPNDPDSFRDAAFQRDLVRSLKPDVPWILMEQATNAVNWRPSNAPKQPGQMAALSWQCVGRGADGVMFFQWRQSRAGAEKFHAAMLPQAGTDTRVWREVTALGEAFAQLPALSAGPTDARVALVMDWENWWALEAPDHPVALEYLPVLHRSHAALHRRHVQVDVVPPSGVRDHHALAIAPLLYLLRDDDATHLAGWVERGGHLLTGPFTDVVDEHDRFRPGGFTTQWRDMLGAEVLEFNALVDPGAAEGEPGAREARFAGVDALTLAGAGHYFAEELRVHDATVEAHFTDGHVAGGPALTARQHGAGVARYLATVPDEAGVRAVVDHVLAEAGVHPVVAGLPDYVEVMRRGDLVTVINQSSIGVAVELPGRDFLTDEPVGAVELPGFGVQLLRHPAR
ncbi:beta-galactosidase [Microcella alkaliphila]|uniref:Beta-galactosidase n=1 Tax=Microcella alkaliphila TaxID=279828 RepID=A0A4Q7TKN5_9MICO|nr:beta-galactosidase [Microcella alkaliphila]RZT60717.1 beta-galactosidase [Microcella alkaliphila]